LYLARDAAKDVGFYMKPWFLQRQNVAMDTNKFVGSNDSPSNNQNADGKMTK